MLQTVNIANVALIDKTILNFENGLNVISGETGAGKSILLDSLNFVLGGRADKSLIRHGANSMKVEAIFSNLSDTNINKIKDELSIDCNDELFLSRELDYTGKNICKINGELIPLSSVKKISSMLVDIHGQSEHLAILNNDYQLKIIDMYANSEEYLNELNHYIDQHNTVNEEICSLGGDESEKQNLIDLYTYQINEIDNANICENEYDELLNERDEMRQFEKINDNLRACHELMAQNTIDISVFEKLSAAIKFLSIISDIPQYRELESRLRSVLIEVEDIDSAIIDRLDNNIFDEERFRYLEDRLDLIKSLFRKYGGDYPSMMDYRKIIETKLNNLLNSTERYQELVQEKEKILEKIEKIQQNLTNIRQNSAKNLILKLENELKILGMPNAKMDVEFGKIDEEFSRSGVDRVEFMFSSNLGFELKPLNKVVSGGEMSRVMLAYKIVVSEVDDIETIVFDEIDSGLSGQVATTVSEYMARLSRYKQIIAVSHLPQICAMADNNIKVEKYSDSVTTHTHSLVLEDEMLYREISRLMGAGVDEMGLAVSRELKEKSNNYKNNLK